MTSTLLYISTVFFAGIISFFSPCILPLLPVYFSVLTSGNTEAEADAPLVFSRKVQVLRTILFVSGIAFCFVLLGFGAGALGSLINSDILLVVMGIIVIILGLHQTGLIKIKWLYREKKMNIKWNSKTKNLSVFLLGFAFSFGWTPCIGPVLATILGLAAGSGTALYGGFLMAVYSLGLAIPFIVLALFSGVLLNKIKSLNKHLEKIKIIGGILIIIMGVMLMTNNFNLLSAWIGGLQ